MIPLPPNWTYYPTIVFVTAALHLTWAVGIALEPDAVHATALHTMLAVTGSWEMAAGVYAVVGILAILGCFERPMIARLSLIIWQHAALWVSVFGAVLAMYLGQYADGVIRPRWFLIVDQAPIVLLALGHAAAMLLIWGRGDG